MRFTTARLCGGKAFMAISADILDIDLKHAAEVLKAEGCEIKEQDDMLLVFEWQGKEVTLYPQGKVMYLPQTDRAQCIKDATDLLEKVSRRFTFYRVCSSGSSWTQWSRLFCALP